MSLTLFEKIINREIPADIIYEDELSIVIKDIQPQAPTHLLIIPKKVIPKLSDGIEEDRETLGHLMLVAGRVADLLNLDNTFRIVINNGAKAGQSVLSKPEFNSLIRDSSISKPIVGNSLPNSTASGIPT